MAKREYWPADMVDERMPEGRDNPTAWIKGAAGDAYELHRAEDIFSGGVGQIASIGEDVEFRWSEDLGTIRIKVHADGRWTGPTPPAEADTFYDFETETVGGDLDEIAEAYVEFAEREEYPIEVDVYAAKWGRSTCRLVADEAGVRFIERQPDDTVKPSDVTTLALLLIVFTILFRLGDMAEAGAFGA